MELILLHSAQVEASRAIVVELGGELAQDDVTINHDGRDVRIVSKHSLAVGLCPSFSAYPAIVVIEDGGVARVKSPVGTWAECLEFIDNPPVTVPAKQTRFSPAEFMRLLTKDELDAVLAAEATDIDVKRMWAFIRAVGYVDMTDPLTDASLQLLRAKNYLPTDERLQQVRDGVFQL